MPSIAVYGCEFCPFPLYLQLCECSAVQCGAARCGAVRVSACQCGDVCCVCCVVWCGALLCGAVWCCVCRAIFCREILPHVGNFWRGEDNSIVIIDNASLHW